MNHLEINMTWVLKGLAIILVVASVLVVAVLALIKTASMTSGAEPAELAEIQAMLDDTLAKLIAARDALQQGTHGGSPAPAPAPAPASAQPYEANAYLIGFSHAVSYEASVHSGALAHVQEDGEYRLFFTKFEKGTSGSDALQLTAASALVDPWVPPPPPGEYYQYISRTAHVPSLCSVYMNDINEGYGAAIGFTSAART